MLMLKLDRRSREPLYMQVFSQISRMVESEVLKPGTALPSSRRLAGHLGVNRSTVVRAYEELWAGGYIHSRSGAYSTVRRRTRIAAADLRASSGAFDWDILSSPAAGRLMGSSRSIASETPGPENTDTINLARLDMDCRLFPNDDFRRCMNHVLLRSGSEILNYGDYQGYAPLRRIICRRLQLHGMSVNEEEILIVNGSQNGIDLILKLLARPGASVAIETPTYAKLLPLLKYHQLDIVPLAMTADGPDLEILKKSLTRQRPRFLYTIPNFHNPTGITTSQPRREQLLSICSEHEIPLVEDGFEEEMKYFGQVPPPIKSMDREHRVLYLGTFSKVLFPGVRIGWIVADRECIQRLTALKQYSDLSSGLVVQAAIHEFCRRGYYDHHIKRMHRIYRRRLQVALESLDTHIPPGSASWHRPGGGYLIWLKLHMKNGNERELLNRLLACRVYASPGSSYFPDATPDLFLRLSISTLNEEEIQRGIRRLGRALADLQKKGGT